MAVACVALTVVGLAGVGAPVVAQDAPAPVHPGSRPRVHLIATGGTISNTDDDGRLTGDEIAARVPGLADRVDLSVEQFSNIASGRMTPDLWLRLARRVRNAFDSIPDLAGIVITHGTDTMEETAYFLDLVIGDDRPVIVTGAMRNNSRLSADGPANLFNAARLASIPGARGRGTMIVMNDLALPAREATKMNTIRVQAFEAHGRGPVAILDPDTVIFIEPPGERAPPVIDVNATGFLPRVDILYSYAGADGALVDAAVEAGARGIVVAAVGRGGLTPGQADAFERALGRGVDVAVSSRTMTGRVPVGTDADRLEGWRPGRGVRFGAGSLTPQKARILLMLALAATDRPEQVLEVFRTRWRRFE